MARTYERFMCGDTVRARTWARIAVDAGRRQGVPLAVALGRVATARIVILDGGVEEGLELLDEAAVSVVSGELDPLGAGMVYCELICAMQGLAQYDRAEQWTEAMDRWRANTAYGGINGRCRVHRAEILRLRGSCAEAEREALEACRELRPWMRREFGWPLTELGTIRLRKGDLAGAEAAFLEAHGHGWDPQPGLALLRLAQGDVAAARTLIDDALERPCAVPSKEWPPYGELRTAPLLAAQVEIAVTAGDISTGRSAAGRLAEIATIYRSRALAAAASAAHGRVAVGDGDVASAVRRARTRSPAGARWARRTSARRPAWSWPRRTASPAASTVRRWRSELPGRRSTGSVRGLPARPGREPLPDHGRCVFRLDGDTRTVVFAGRSVPLHDLKGMRHLARLLAAPDREFHVLDLTAGERGDAVPPDGDEDGPVLDEQARAAYKRRLAEIDEDLDEAPRARRRRARHAGPGGPRLPGPGTGRRLRTRWPVPAHRLLVGARAGERHAGAALRDRPGRRAPRPWPTTWRGPCAPGRTAATHPIRAWRSTGNCDEHPVPARPAGIEPATKCLEGTCSIH